MVSRAEAAPESTPHDETVPHVHQEAAPAKDESPVDYFWRKSDEAFHAGDYPRAVGLHRAIVALDPSDVESYSVGAWLLWSLGKPDEAVQFLQVGLKANPKDPEMWDAAAQHYDLQKRFTDSESAYAKAVELSGKDAPQLLRRRYAHAAEHAGDWNKSVEIWRALVADYPDEAVNKNNLARVEKGTKAEVAPAPTAAVATAGAAALAVLSVFTVPGLGRKKANDAI